LQLLLKKCDYQPGDALVFLGDLVAKGPDSCGVVQMVIGNCAPVLTPKRVTL